MPITQKHRSSIFRSLSPILGEEETEALLSDHPITEADELATKSLVREEVAVLRAEMYEQFAKVHQQVAKVHEGLRMRTVWCCGAIFGAVGLAVTLTSVS